VVSPCVGGCRPNTSGRLPFLLQSAARSYVENAGFSRPEKTPNIYFGRTRPQQQ
jgi:hypothetical protein